MSKQLIQDNSLVDSFFAFSASRFRVGTLEVRVVSLVNDAAHTVVAPNILWRLGKHIVNLSLLCHKFKDLVGVTISTNPPIITLISNLSELRQGILARCTLYRIGVHVSPRYLLDNLHLREGLDPRSILGKPLEWAYHSRRTEQV